MMRTRLLIDTNVWLAMVEDHRKASLLGVIEDMVGRGTVDLIVPEIVVDEFRHRRDEVAATTTSSLASHIRAVREALPRVPVNQTTLPATMEHLAEMAQRVHLVGTASHVLLDRIESLLHGKVKAHSPEVLRNASKRAIERKAPFHLKNKNSFADTLIIEAYAETLNHEARSAFVTYNITDFSQRGADQRLPHEDLSEFFDGTQSRYFIDLLEALRWVDPNAVSEIMLRTDPTVGDLIHQRLKDMNPTPPYKATIAYALDRFKTMPIATKNAATLQAADIIEHCRMRREVVSAATVKQEVAYLQSTFRLASKSNPDITIAAFVAAKPTLLKHQFIGNSKKREVRLTDEDIERLLARLEETDGHGKAKFPGAELVRFTLASALRIGQICSLEWRHIRAEDRSCELRGWGGTRQGKAIRIKFSDEAWEIVQRQQTARDGRVFPYQAASVGHRVTRALSDLGLRHLRLDDVRREAEIRMYSAGKSITEIYAMTGLKGVDPLIERLEAARLAEQEARANAPSDAAPS